MFLGLESRRGGWQSCLASSPDRPPCKGLASDAPCLPLGALHASTKWASDTLLAKAGGEGSLVSPQPWDPGGKGSLLALE